MKHLSRMITAHNCFCSFFYNLVTLVIMPVFSITVAVVLMRLDGYIGLVVMMTILAESTVLADYLTLNGITSKVFSLGMIKNSPYIESFLKDAILADQIKRFLQITVPPIISMIIYASISSKRTDLELLLFALTLIFLNYSTTTGTLTLIRNILANTTYVYISMALNVVFGVINAGMMFLFVHDSIHIPSMIWFPISFISSVMISIWTFHYTADRCLNSLKEI